MFTKHPYCGIIFPERQVKKVTELTKREKQILEYIQKSVTEKGYPPSVREIGEAVGLTSTSTVHSYLKRLEKKGCLRRGSSMPRAISIRPGVVSVPVLGKIAAGSPVPAVEYREDILTLPADLAGNGELFALRVRGNSMVDAGIFDGVNERIAGRPPKKSDYLPASRSVPVPACLQLRTGKYRPGK